jgi:hypothetical protein
MSSTYVSYLKLWEPVPTGSSDPGVNMTCYFTLVDASDNDVLAEYSLGNSLGVPLYYADSDAPIAAVQTRALSQLGTFLTESIEGLDIDDVQFIWL